MPGFRLTSPTFLDDDEDKETSAYQQISNVPKVTFVTEFHVLRIAFVVLSLIASHLVVLPWLLLRYLVTFRLFATPENVHAFSVFLSFVLAVAAVKIAGVSLDSALALMRGQHIYKLWAAYALVKVVLRFAVRPHAFTHRMLRGAVRAGSLWGIAAAIVLRAVSTAVQFVLYAIVNGCYLAGLYGRPHLFFSACFHIQAVIAKKYFPKPLEAPPEIEEPIGRIVNCAAVLCHFGDGELEKIATMVEYEFIWAAIRFFLVALTSDGAKLLSNMKRAGQTAIWQFQNGESRFQAGLIVRYPFEPLAIVFFGLLFRGKIVAKNVVRISLLFAALVAPFIINRIKVEKPPSDEPEKKKKKEKGGKGKDKPPKAKEE
jgi:hypothetical protein